MSMHRETIFHCTYAASGTRRTAVVPAWDARAAETLFRALLEEDEAGDTTGGVIEIEAPGGRLAHRAPYTPPA
jgi:hypothetical protein